MGFFYVSNPPGDDRDLLNLPEFSLPPPTQHHWSEKPGETDTDVDRQMARIGELMEQGLTATDLVAAWLTRRVLPLQQRCHRICDVSGRRDPSRISTFQMDLDEFLRRMHSITALKVDQNFRFGLRAYNRQNPPHVVCCCFRTLIFSLLSSFSFCDPISIFRSLLLPGSWRMGKPDQSTTPTVLK